MAPHTQSLMTFQVLQQDKGSGVVIRLHIVNLHRYASYEENKRRLEAYRVPLPPREAVVLCVLPPLDDES
jgi:hypothetical protein